MLNENEIKASDIILRLSNINGVSKTQIWHAGKESGITDIDIIHAAAHLEKYDFITSYKRVNEPMYKLNTKGLEFARSGKSYVEYLSELKKEEQNKRIKDELDFKLKSFQLEDLVFRLKTIEDMQERQKKFWGKQNLSLLIAIGAFLLSILNFIKDILLP
ncbi:MAG: hypothetical protein IT269_08120 [Saprospiraceae bacterium]|nr:hypothetical protein [Saprospiraceae bacterium]